MTEFAIANFLLSLAALFVIAKIMGELFERMQMPSLLGELLAGVILGPAVLGLMYASVGDVYYILYDALASIGIVMLLFVAGFEEVNISEMLANKKAALMIGTIGLAVPLLGVGFVAFSINGTWFPEVSTTTIIFLATALSATSVGIAFRTLIDVGEIESKIGRTVVGALIVDDIIGLLLLTLVIGFATVGQENLAGEAVMTLVGIFAFFLLFIIAEKLTPLMMRYVVKLRVEEAQFSLVFVVVLVAAYLAETFGLNIIIGAFFAGIALSHSSLLETESFSQKLSTVSYGLFIPIFFAFTGSRIVFEDIMQTGQLALLFFFVVAVTQLISVYLPAKYNGYTNRESLAMAAAIIPRGEIALVIMSALLLLAQTNPAAFGSMEAIKMLFSAVMILIALTIIATPLIMKAALSIAD